MPPETSEQAEARLLRVIGAAQLQVLEGAYTFSQLPSGHPPKPNALACVRDGEMWAQLIPASRVASADGLFKMFSSTSRKVWTPAGLSGGWRLT